MLNDHFARVSISWRRIFYACLLSSGFMVLALGNEGQAASVYKWVDATGNVHFTDRSVKGAVKVNVPPLQGYRAPVPRSSRHTSPVAAVNKTKATLSFAPPISYQLHITAPSQEATLRAANNQVSLSVAVKPALAKTDYFVAWLDGKRVVSDVRASPIVVAPVYRGVHTLQVAIEDKTQQILAQSSVLTVFMKPPRI